MLQPDTRSSFTSALSAAAPVAPRHWHHWHHVPAGDLCDHPPPGHGAVHQDAGDGPVRGTLPRLHFSCPSIPVSQPNIMFALIVKSNLYFTSDTPDPSSGGGGPGPGVGAVVLDGAGDGVGHPVRGPGHHGVQPRHQGRPSAEANKYFWIVVQIFSSKSRSG